jgi:hypothetical protein
VRLSYACLAFCCSAAACFSDGDPTSDDGATGTTESTPSSTSADDGIPQPTSDTPEGSGSGSGDTASPGTDSTDPGSTGSESGPVVDESGSTTADNPCADEATYTEVDACPEPIGDAFCSEGQDHVPQDSKVAWAHEPPHSGPHYPTWETWGEHLSTVPRGNWVHNLEHGGIVFAYLCPGGCEEQLDVFREVIELRPDLRILLTPDPELDAAGFAAISWTWVYQTTEPDLETLLCFVDQHENHAPEDVP